MTADSLTPDELHAVVLEVFPPDMPIKTAVRILSEPTMWELSRYGSAIKEALEAVEAHR